MEAAAVAEPFRSLDDLYSKLDNLTAWPKVIELRESTEYVYKGNQADTESGELERLDRDRQPRTIVCHDMKGGYLEDRFIHGSTAHDSYLFYHWSMIDTFIYFSHKMLTVPPYGWINAAHSHGVKILGTLITEGGDGEKIWERVLSNRNETRKLADALVAVAKFYKFEGWLLNVENKITAGKIDDLIYFVNYLTDSIHAEIQGSEIIWYDSVTHDGELKWQNELNSHNERFFHNCDGIFLNYNWSDSTLANSYTVAERSNRIRDVYVGLDVWGRGCPGGGGFNSAHALERIRKHNLSVAIFAPGWTHEYFGPETFSKIENIFWSQLIPHLYIHVPIYDKEIFRTSFCRGSGLNYYRLGQIYTRKSTEGDSTWPNNPFYNLSLQKPQILAPGLHSTFTFMDIPPTINSNDKNAPSSRPEYTFETPFEIMKVNEKKITFVTKDSTPPINRTEFCDEYSYEGGSSLKLIFNNKERYHRLFLVHIDFDQAIQVSLVYRKNPTEIWQNRIARGNPKLILGNDTGVMILRPVETSDLDSQWRRSVYLTSLRTINEIGVGLDRNGSCCLGELVVQPMSQFYKDSGI